MKKLTGCVCYPQSERTEKMAWSAVKYLHDHLQRKDPFILAQTPSEVMIVLFTVSR